ncbi:MAG TPA: RNA polymerase-binding protein RbpA, partial [Actinomycetota bacterium]|nr:RNA polymerase-binding protein RbpA [Actinomycetota bacterium]
MSEALRGTRLGSTSLENDRDVEFAPRMTVTY